MNYDHNRLADFNRFKYAEEISNLLSNIIKASETLQSNLKDQAEDVNEEKIKNIKTDIELLEKLLAEADKSTNAVFGTKYLSKSFINILRKNQSILAKIVSGFIKYFLSQITQEQTRKTEADRTAQEQAKIEEATKRQIQELKEESRKLRQERDEAIKAGDAKQIEIDQLQTDKQTANDEIKAVKDALQKSQQTVQALETKIEELKSEIESLNKFVEKIDSFSEDLNSLHSENNDLFVQVVSLKSENANLSAQIADSQNESAILKKDLVAKDQALKKRST